MSGQLFLVLIIVIAVNAASRPAKATAAFRSLFESIAVLDGESEPSMEISIRFLLVLFMFIDGSIFFRVAAMFGVLSFVIIRKELLAW